MQQYKMIILLEDFENSDEESLPKVLKLSHGWSLSKIKSLHLPDGTFEHFGKLVAPLHQEKLSSCEFALARDFELSDTYINDFASTNEYKQLVRHSHWLGVALRLIRPGHFVMHRIVAREQEDDWYPVQSTLIRDRYYQPAGFSIFEDLYTNADQKKIKDYSKYLIELADTYSTKHNRPLNSLDLFNEALKQYRYDTKLILMVSAIESLFNFSKGQTTEKIAFGASRFIEPDPSKRTKLYNEVRDLYNVRSGLIHGSRLDKIRKQKFYDNIPLQKEVARLAYDIIAKSFERIIYENLANDFDNSSLLANEYNKAVLGQKSSIF